MFSIEAMIMGAPVPIACACGHEIKTSLGELQTNDHLVCPNCGVGIALEKSAFTNETEGVRASAASLDKTLKDFEDMGE